MSEELRQLKLFIEAANQSNSSNDKLQVIRNFPQCQKMWKYAYDKINYRYGIKAKNIVKNEAKLIDKMSNAICYNTIYELLDALAAREVTGHEAIKAVMSFTIRYPEYKDIVYNILDRNLKTRTDAKLFNKAYPKCIEVFDIALATDIEDYDPDKKKVNFQRDHWWASRKLDGCLDYDSSIFLEDGTNIKIGELVEKQLKCKVKCFNTETQEVEFKCVRDWMKNLNDINDNDTEWYRIELDNGLFIELTGNHLVYLPNLNCWRRADQLTCDDVLLIN